MSTYGWPEEIQEFPKIAEPPEEEPIQRTCKDECAIFHDITDVYVTGKPYTVEQ